MHRNSLPLTGIRVVTVEQAVSAPFCSRQLADLGADVIKIERPDGGDFARGYDDVLRGVSAYFAWLNRGKRSLTLDLKEVSGRELLVRLLRRTDIFIQNLKPNAAERLGLSYEQLSKRNPQLIWCGISGYGPDGPYCGKKAYDFLVQSEAGLVSLTGTQDAPAKVGISVADIASGMYAYSSILAALLNRSRIGHGDRIDISMLECLTEWMMPAIYVWSGTGTAPKRCGLSHNMIVPYGAYRCSDGEVNFAIQNEREWREFCDKVLGTPALACDARFQTNGARLRNRRELEGILEEHFSAYTRSEILELLERADIANGPINDIASVVAHPQLAARRRWAQVSTPAGSIPALLPPHNLRCAPPRMSSVPALGEHTEQILAELSQEGD